MLSIKEKEYIQAARALGAGPRRIMFIDILPNLLAPLIVLQLAADPGLDRGRGDAVVPWCRRAAAHGRLGPDDLDASGFFLYGPWWYLLFPSLALLFTTLAFNIFGDRVRDAFDPRGDLYV